MDTKALVYVDLDGVPHLMGRLWARRRKNKESATFEYDKAWRENPARFSLEPALQVGPGPFHTPRHAHVRRHRRLRARPLGADAHAPHGTQARGARGRGAARGVKLPVPAKHPDAEGNPVKPDSPPASTRSASGP